MKTTSNDLPPPRRPPPAEHRALPETGLRRAGPTPAPILLNGIHITQQEVSAKKPEGGGIRCAVNSLRNGVNTHLTNTKCEADLKVAGAEGSSSRCQMF